MERRPYSTRFNPPAPLATLQVGVPHGKMVESTEALVDSGADITVIPRTVVEHLGLRMVDIVPVAGFSTAAAGCPVYSACISLEGRELGVTRLISWAGAYALLGRDILNQFKALLDGPEGFISLY